MRISVALFFAAIVCAAQAQLLVPDLLGSLGQSAGDRIKDLRKNIDETLQRAEEFLQNSFKKTREQAEIAYERVEEAARKVNERVQAAVDKVEESVQKQVDQLAQSVVGKGVDVSSCTGLVKTFREAAGAIIRDDVSCVTSKVQKAKDIVTDILNKGQEILDIITSIRSKSNACVENVQGITAQVSAVSCLVSVGAKDTWALTTKVSAVANDYAQAITLINTLAPSLSFCVSNNSLLALTEQGKVVISDVRKCIADRVSAIGGSVIPEVPQVPESPVPFPPVPTSIPDILTSTSKLALPDFEEVPPFKLRDLYP